MGQVGSYRADTFAVGREHEIRRLDAQVELFWRTEQHALERAGLRDGMDVLDCGCGPGRLISLLTSAHAGLRVTGLEIDPGLVAIAQAHLTGAGLEHCRVLQGSAEVPNLPAESFDFIVMRLVLEHLVDPIEALRQMKELLRPGGRIAIISNDFRFHLRTWPEVAELDDLYEAYIASRTADGGDPCIGRRVPGLLAEAGFRLVGFEAEVAHNLMEGDPAFLLAEGAGIPAKLVETGYLDEGVFQRLVSSWRSMLEEPDHMIMRPLFIAVGEKSDPVAESPRPPVAASRPKAADHLEYVAPTSEMERAISQIWADVIGLERVGVTQNFFDLGGTSLMLEHVQLRLESHLGRDLPLTLLFQHPTVAALAHGLETSPGDGAGHTERSEPDPAPASEVPPVSPPAASDQAISRQAQRRRDALMRRRAPRE